MLVRSSLLSLPLCLLSLACQTGSSDDDTAADDDTVTDDDTDSSGSLPFLHAQGTRIVDSEDQEILLRGVNLGSWLYHETWISNVDYTATGRLLVEGERAGIREAVKEAILSTGAAAGDYSTWLDAVGANLPEGTDSGTWETVRAEALACPDVNDDSDLPLRDALTDRFGREGRDAVLRAFTDSWITETDIATLASLGGNLVRVPTGYRIYLEGTDDWHKDPVTSSFAFTNEDTFSTLDRLLDWCDSHGVYAILDMQESPGGHNDYSGEATLYQDEEAQEATVALWLALAGRYRDRGTVAAYSLLAEPMSAPSVEAMVGMYDTLVQAIRATGDDHLMVIHDGFNGMYQLPRPEDMGWEGVIYSTHLFEWGSDSLKDYQGYADLYSALFSSSQMEQNVPYFVGSFSTMEDAGWAYESFSLLTDLFTQSGWSWSLWTWKKVDDPLEAELWGTSTSWGVWQGFGEDSGWLRADVCHDTEETLKTHLGTYGTAGMEPNSELHTRIGEAFTSP